MPTSKKRGGKKGGGSRKKAKDPRIPVIDGLTKAGVENDKVWIVGVPNRKGGTDPHYAGDKVVGATAETEDDEDGQQKLIRLAQPLAQYVHYCYNCGDVEKCFVAAGGESCARCQAKGLTCDVKGCPTYAGEDSLEKRLEWAKRQEASNATWIKDDKGVAKPFAERDPWDPVDAQGISKEISGTTKKRPKGAMANFSGMTDDEYLDNIPAIKRDLDECKRQLLKNPVQILQERLEGLLPRAEALQKIGKAPEVAGHSTRVGLRFPKSKRPPANVYGRKSKGKRTRKGKQKDKDLLDDGDRPFDEDAEDTADGDEDEDRRRKGKRRRDSRDRSRSLGSRDTAEGDAYEEDDEDDEEEYESGEEGAEADIAAVGEGGNAVASSSKRRNTFTGSYKD